MANPVTGPFNDTKTTVDHFHQRTKWKQGRPIDRPLRFTGRFTDVSQVKGQQQFFQDLPHVASRMETVPSNLVNAALLQAYERCRGAVSDKAQMGVFLAELEQAAGTIAKRAFQIAELLIVLRKKGLSAAFATLKRPYPKGKVSKGFASDWLELSFGWIPAISDIYSAVDVLQNPIKSIRPGGIGFGGVHNVTELSGSFPNEASKTVWHAEVRGKVGFECLVSNPNLFLANNLGLINPGTIAWELIPFSFVVDWFIPVESFLSYGSDLYGLSVTNAWNTIYTRGAVYDYQKSITLGRYGERWCSAAYVNRVLGLPGPQLFVRPFKVPSWRRALNATSLVVQLLGGR